jgi:hypothetical protein
VPLVGPALHLTLRIRYRHGKATTQSVHTVHTKVRKNLRSSEGLAGHSLCAFLFLVPARLPLFSRAAEHAANKKVAMVSNLGAATYADLLRDSSIVANHLSKQ